MSNQLDAVIIGAGHNSLACACHLAARGWKVGVYEQAAEPGGAVKTGEYTLPGFRHDWAAMNLSLFAGSAFHTEKAAELAGHGLAFAPTSHPFASVFPDGRWFGVSADAALTTARVRGFSDADADTWARLTADFPNQAESIFGVLGAAMNLRAISSVGWKLWRKNGGGGSLDLARFMMMSPRAWLDETFESDHIKATLAAWGMHLDFAPDVAGGAVFPYLEAMAGQAFGMVLGQGGADTITKAMVKMIEARGGAVHCNAEVTGIKQAAGRAFGIILKDGTLVEADKAVIANVSPSALLKLTDGTGSTRHEQAMKSYQHAPGTMMIHLAMDALPNWTAAELKRFAYVHMAPSMDQMARTYAQAKAGLLPDEPVIVCGQPTVVDPSRAPDGKHVLWLQVRMAPGEIKGDAGATIDATNWQEAAEPFAERALDILERYAPGTRAHIIGRHIVTPEMLEADNPNLVGGDQVCGSHHLHQHFMNRPARGYADGTTPIKNLYHTGAAVWPGGGTGAGPGTLLAKKLVGN
ncbi:putative dehydrogenase [Sulfitobacter noctilucicola]|uniref:Pyridine nucleotide-disulfide oxidoreductase domain-containing protein 2 n=1 Tax=Sulfitobacter noctilucicola TaxID=1342301 RepID=A0A7W6MAE3_9RHOB|nr:NAD(P)/FAD-dependent oxidoreductase [Sulfitobacter noctilucicola]KIN63875.1 putative dehydrogenase [Sulfitobacter noctilucicola]MBB4174617.1 phytoene dehydrogenase-like protein [Sulfitobacter noctilucicola]